MRTQVAIIGAGPAGLTLALLLQREGIDVAVLEARPRAYVEARVRAGLLEQNTVELLRELGVAGRLERECLQQPGIFIRRLGQTSYLDMHALTGRHTTVYGQQEVVKDLIAALEAHGVPLLFEVSDVRLDGLRTDAPRVHFTHAGNRHELSCEFVAGCDGFHGVSRESIPRDTLVEHHVVHPCCWLGILANAPPATKELIYAWHPNGFSLYSMRSPSLSRLYLQVNADEQVGNWPDERIWEELQRRLASEGCQVSEGEVIEKGITKMRSFVAEPMQHGRLFLAGDAAHIVPPTAAKGLNLAVNDVRILARALATHNATGSTELLEAYSETALRRVWRAQDFSNEMLHLFHRIEGTEFERRLQLARLEQLEHSPAAARSFAENYVGPPAAADF